jgi:pimeloyl-ACP methyl ester carboxylesterase
VHADLRDVVPRVAVPTLLLCGDQDVRAPSNVRRELHAGIAGSKLVVIPGAGHVCNIDTPERFNAEVRAFLMELSSGACHRDPGCACWWLRTT